MGKRRQQVMGAAAKAQQDSTNATSCKAKADEAKSKADQEVENAQRLLKQAQDDRNAKEQAQKDALACAGISSPPSGGKDASKDGKDGKEDKEEEEEKAEGGKEGTAKDGEG